MDLSDLVYRSSPSNARPHSSWKKKFALLPVVSNTSGRLIWLKWAYCAQANKWVTTENSVSIKSMNIWITQHEHLLEMLKSTKTQANDGECEQSPSVQRGH